MPTRKTESGSSSLKVEKMDAPVVEKPRKFSEVVKQIKKMREAGKTVPEITTEMKVSYSMVNQLMLRSYKMTSRTEEVFARQEQMRLGLM